VAVNSITVTLLQWEIECRRAVWYEKTIWFEREEKCVLGSINAKGVELLKQIL